MGRARKAQARKPLASKDFNVPPRSEQDGDELSPSLVKQQMIDINHQEAERRRVAIRAVRDAESEGYLTQLRIALSMLSEELRAMPLREFVSRYCPDREWVRSPDSGIIELRPKPLNPNNSRDCPSAAGSFEFQTDQPMPSLQHLTQPTPCGFPFLNSAVKDALLRSVDKMACNECEDEEFLKFLGSFRSSKYFHGNPTTPAMDCQVKVGMTPKTVRLPKKGETLLSVNGSPLGVFQEESTTLKPERTGRARRRLRSPMTLSKV